MKFITILLCSAFAFGCAPNDDSDFSSSGIFTSGLASQYSAVRIGDLYLGPGNSSLIHDLEVSFANGSATWAFDFGGTSVGSGSCPLMNQDNLLKLNDFIANVSDQTGVPLSTFPCNNVGVGVFLKERDPNAAFPEKSIYLCEDTPGYSEVMALFNSYQATCSANIR